MCGKGFHQKGKHDFACIVIEPSGETLLIPEPTIGHSPTIVFFYCRPVAHIWLMELYVLAS